MKKSKSGYKRSRANAITHGFYATDELFLASLKPKERRSFNKLRDTLHTEYHPQTVRETILVDRLAILHFRQYRLYSLEALAIDQTGTKPLAPVRSSRISTASPATTDASKNRSAPSTTASTGTTTSARITPSASIAAANKNENPFRQKNIYCQ